MYHAWVLEANKEVTRQHTFTISGQEGVVLVPWEMECGEGDDRAWERVVVGWHPFEPVREVVLSRGNEARLPPAVIIVGMEGSLLDGLKSVGHGAQRQGWGG